MIALATGPAFRAHRRLLGSSMSASSLAAFVPRIAAAAQDLVALWTERAELSAHRPFGASDGALRGITCTDSTDLLICTTDAAASISFATPLNVATAGLAKLQQTEADDVIVKDGVIGHWRLERPALMRDVETLFLVRRPIAHMLTCAGRVRAHHLCFPAFEEDRDPHAPGLAPCASQRPRCRACARRRCPARARRDEQLCRGRGQRRRAFAVSLPRLTGQDIMISKGGEQLDSDALIDEALLFLIAVRRGAMFPLTRQGSETTATALSWGVKHLARHPDVQRRLRNELSSRLRPFDERVPTHAEITDPGLHYLNAVVHEILRIARTVPLVFREGLSHAAQLQLMSQSCTTRRSWAGRSREATRSSA